METLNLKGLVEGYQRNMKALDRELSKLEHEAATIHNQLDQRKASSGLIGSLEGKRADLAGEREELREAYQEASFEGDTDELERIQDRRAQIDEDLAKLTEDINAERMVLKEQEVDAKHNAKVAVQRDLLKPISLQAFIEKLTERLQADANLIDQRIRSIKIDSSMYDREEYDRLRSGKDMNYAMFLSRERRLAAKEEEKRKKMRPVSSTDEMHSIQSGNRKRPEDRMSVTSKGEKVKTYAERTAPHDEQDRSRVLSGDEVQRILAEKNARKAS